MKNRMTKVARHCRCKNQPWRLGLYPDDSSIGITFRENHLYVTDGNIGQFFTQKCTKCDEIGTIIVSKAWV